MREPQTSEQRYRQQGGALAPVKKSKKITSVLVAGAAEPEQVVEQNAEQDEPPSVVQFHTTTGRQRIEVSPADAEQVLAYARELWEERQ